MKAITPPKFIQELKPHTKFGDYNISVYRATFKGSAVPEIGARHRLEFKADERFEIVAVTRAHDGLPEWYQKQIYLLFQEHELQRGIESAMSDYGRRGGYDEEDPEFPDIKKHGMVAYVQLVCVILDQAKNEIVVEMRTEKEGNLSEHGMTVYRKQGKWRFAHAEYLSGYLEQFEDAQYREASDRKTLAYLEESLKETEQFWKKGAAKMSPAEKQVIDAALAQQREAVENARRFLAKKKRP